MKIKKVHILDHHTCRIWEKGFFTHHAYLLQNEYLDGSLSRPYRNEFFDRKGLDCVAIFPYRKISGHLEIGILRAFRPAVYFRSQKKLPMPEKTYTWIYESVAGSLEPGDTGEKGIRKRASLELAEEAGFRVNDKDLISLGGSFFPSHGQSTEKIHLFAVDVSQAEIVDAIGDGSVNESLNVIEFHEINEILSMCRDGQIEDPKVEIGASRLNNVF
ncbi:MAG: hypothetical protein GXO70_09380 [Acidobacteria bacterium]|nr:hypothetical protein [Acidobacteriota bacterium]